MFHSILSWIQEVEYKYINLQTEGIMFIQTIGFKKQKRELQFEIVQVSCLDIIICRLIYSLISRIVQIPCLDIIICRLICSLIICSLKIFQFMCINNQLSPKLIFLRKQAKYIRSATRRGGGGYNQHSQHDSRAEKGKESNIKNTNVQV